MRDRLQSRRRRADLADRVREESAPSGGGDPVEDLLGQELLDRVRSILADLAPSYAQAFHLRVREGFSYRQMAEICDEPEGTLRSRVHHALGRIRRGLAADGYLDAPRESAREDSS